MSHLHKITVIIPTYKRPKTLNKTLKVLSKQYPKPYQVIVVDNSSNQEASLIVSLFKNTLPIEYYVAKKRGPSYARNIGYEHARGEIIALLDDDCVPTNNWCKEIINTYKTNAYAHVVFQEKCQHIFPNTNFMTEMFYFRNTRYKTTGFREDKFRVIDGVHAGCCFMNRSVLYTLRYLFDTELFPFIGEEYDFSIRAQLAGCIFLEHNKVSVTHYKQPLRRIDKSFHNAFMIGRCLGITQYKYPVASKVIKLFSKEKNSIQKKEFFAIMTNYSLFLRRFKQKSVFWKISAFLYEVLRSTIIYFGYIYGSVWYVYYAKRFKNTSPLSTFQ